MLTKHFPYAMSFKCGNRSQSLTLVRTVWKLFLCYTFLKSNCSVLFTLTCRRRSWPHAYQAFWYEIWYKMPASWATSLHNVTWWTSSKSLLTMPTVTTDVTHWCWCFTDTALQSVFNFTNFLQFSVYFKVFTMWILKFHLQAPSCMQHSTQNISYFTNLLCGYNRTNTHTHKHNSTSTLTCASHFTQRNNSQFCCPNTTQYFSNNVNLKNMYWS